MQRKNLELVLKNLTARVYALLGDKLDRVVLYGSYARGDNSEDSDVDILVLTRISAAETKKYNRELNKIFSRVGLENDILLSMFLLDKDAYLYWLPAMPFYQNIEKDGVVLYVA